MSYLFRSSILLNCVQRHSKVTFANLNPAKPSVWQNVRLFGNSGNSSRAGGRAGGRAFVRSQTISPGKETRSLKEILMQPTTGAPFKFGASMVAGASVFGMLSIIKPFNIIYSGFHIIKNRRHRRSLLLWIGYEPNCWSLRKLIVSC